MKRVYVIYLTIDGDALFSKPFPTFQLAKENTKTFLEKYASDLGKKTSFVSKEEFTNIKTLKLPEDLIYIRKKNSSATVYKRVTSIGRIYNSYSIEKIGKLGITEIDLTEEKTVSETSVENLSHGVHVTFISELKNALSKQKKVRSLDFLEKKEEEKQNPFILSLNERKETLRHITPPPPRKLIL